jgi:DNA (cytosine-5)-methyltransferase 1
LRRTGGTVLSIVADPTWAEGVVRPRPADRRGRPRPTLIDLFSGCGGGSMGFIDAGFRVAAAVEINQNAADSFRLNTGVRPLVRDIRSVSGEELLQSAGLRPGECTVLFGCPPCQSYTVLRRSSTPTAADEIRETLPREYLRMVREIRPQFVAFENVPGMKSGRGRARFDELEAGLESLGYRTTAKVIDAVDYGVAQYRRRVLLVGGLESTPEIPKATHTAGGEGGLPAHRTVRDAIGSMRSLTAGESDPDDPFHAARDHGELALKRLAAIPEGGGRLDLPDDLKLLCHRGHAGHYDVYGRMRWDRPAPTITSGCTNVTRGRFAHPTQDRAITLREAMTLQGMPPTTRLVGSQDSMAQQVGNAIPPTIAKRLALTIAALVRDDIAEAAR